MGIQSRRGNFVNFDPDKLLPGEWAVVVSGDKNSSDGKSVYICFSAGIVKRMSTYEDVKDIITQATNDIINNLTSSINQTIGNANAAISKANTATLQANQSKTNCDQAAQRATAAAEACEGIIDNTRLTALEQDVRDIITVLNQAIIISKGGNS